MTVHLVKLAVGVGSPEDLRRIHEERRRRRGAAFATTRMIPKRAAEIVDGGSIYWVVKGLVLIRQPIVRIERREDDEGRACCDFILGEPVDVAAQPRRPFQGWRYLRAEDAPPDLEKGADGSKPPPEMVAGLRALGLL